MGNVQIELKEFKKATEYFKDTLKANPRCSDAWKAIGNIFFEN